MAFTITRKLEQVPSYAVLSELAREKQVRITGNECIGSFSCRGVAGDYEFGQDRIHGEFAGHGVTGEFTFGIGAVAVTVTDKPFWLPEKLLAKKITEGLDAFCNELGSRRPPARPRRG